VTLATKFMKDAEEGPPIFFDMVKVQATDNRTSLVPVLHEEPPPAATKLPPQKQAALDVLKVLLMTRA
jgi:hypothetical protein